MFPAPPIYLVAGTGLFPLCQRIGRVCPIGMTMITSKTGQLTEFCAKLLSEAFWRDNTIPRKSDNNFHLRSLFVSESIHDTNNPNPIPTNDFVVDNSHDPKTFTQNERRMVSEWRARKNCEFNQLSVVIAHFGR
jgi:hypothetical protein